MIEQLIFMKGLNNLKEWMEKFNVCIVLVMLIYMKRKCIIRKRTLRDSF